MFMGSAFFIIIMVVRPEETTGKTEAPWTHLSPSLVQVTSSYDRKFIEQDK